MWYTLKTEAKIETANETPNDILAERDLEKKMLEMVIDKAGDNLSVGQKQLICVARAFVRKPKVLIMDEATANIDEKTDKDVQELIKSEFKDTTVLTIAHRLNTIIQYDKLLVLKDGTLEEFGRPKDLLEKENGYFHNLVKENGENYYNDLYNLV